MPATRGQTTTPAGPAEPEREARAAPAHLDRRRGSTGAEVPARP
jgi:hypothetical protein